MKGIHCYAHHQRQTIEQGHSTASVLPLPLLLSLLLLLRLNHRSVVMTSLSTCALMNTTGPMPAVITLSPARYSSATGESDGAVASREGRSGMEKMDTAVLKFSARVNETSARQTSTWSR